MTQQVERSAIVFGGTSGIGLATARALIDAGARVTIAGRDPAKGAHAAATLGVQAAYHQADVTRSDQVAAAIDGGLSLKAP